MLAQETVLEKLREWMEELFEIAPELCFPDGLALRDVLANLGAEKPASW